MRTAAIVSLLIASLLAGCFGDGGGDDGPAGPGAGDTPAEEFPPLTFADTDAGEVLVDGAGMTLYVFTNDEPGISHCSGGCATNWPPLLVETIPDAPASIASLLSTIERDGGRQLALEGRPLYYWINDAAPGDASGDGVNGVWFVVRPPPPNADMLDLDGGHVVDAGPVTYFEDRAGHLALPDGGADVGIVVIHEWWGLNDHIRDTAESLASHGYAVLAVDLFGTVADDSDAARAQVEAMDPDQAVANMHAAAQHLRDAGAQRIVGLGWCFGGGQSLRLALSGEDLAGTVIYYGNLVNDSAALAAIPGPVLGVFGEDDAVISVDEVRAFEAGLDDAGIRNDIYIYPDVGHAFANPSAASWAPAQTQDAWQRTLAFLAAA